MTLPKIEGPKTEGTGKGDAAAAKLTADEIAAIKQLPAAEQELALKQAVCPVSDEHLGAMGKPIKITRRRTDGLPLLRRLREGSQGGPQEVPRQAGRQVGKK